MFIIEVSYIKPLSEIDRHLEAHRAFLDECYSKGLLLASGAKVPRTGGIIIACSMNRTELEELLAQDPFRKEQVAEYKITEFVATKCADALKAFV